MRKQQEESKEGFHFTQQWAWASQNGLWHEIKGWGPLWVKVDGRDRTTCNPGLAPGFEGAKRGGNGIWGM